MPRTSELLRSDVHARYHTSWHHPIVTTSVRAWLGHGNGILID